MTSKRIFRVAAPALVGATALLALTALPVLAANEQVPKLGVKDSDKSKPSGSGFIQRWLILEPIAAQGDTQNAVQQKVKAEAYEPMRTEMPTDGQKVSVDGADLTWHAVDTDLYNVNLYYFADEVGTNCNNSLFWVVANVDCPEEMKEVRLAVGTNSASVWWVNGEEVVGIYGNRCTVVDDGVSKRLTLKKGQNTIRGAIINASGAADFCARLLDAQGEPVKGYTVTLEGGEK